MNLLDKMATYVRVVEAGSLSAAAKQLHISAAAVSRQIATLESELRVALLTRSTRRMVVTQAGRSYYERCLRVLREVDEAQAVGHGEGIDGLVRMSAPVTFGLARVVPHVHALMTKHPGLHIDLRLDDRLIDLALEGVDVAVRVGSPPRDTPELVAHRLLSYERVLVASPAYLKRKGVPHAPEALAKHDALTHAAGNNSDAWSLTRDGHETRVRVNAHFRTNALFALRDLAVRGMGIAFLPDWLVADAIASRALRVILPEWTTDAVRVNAIHRTELRGALRVRTLIDHLRSSYAPPPEPDRPARCTTTRGTSSRSRAPAVLDP